MIEPRPRDGLQRGLGPWAAMAMVVGTVIGSGIFGVPTEMVQQVGTPGMVGVVWVFGGVLTLFGALTYAELAAALPQAGGEYVYLREAYGRFFGFLYGWTQTWVAKSASIATLATLFADYLQELVPGVGRVLTTIGLPIGPEGGPLEITLAQVAAMALIVALGVLNTLGVRVGGGVQVAITILKVALIVGIVVVGLSWSGGSAANFRTRVPAEGGMAGFFAALVAALWAYDGWNNVTMVAAEVREPRRNLPRALVGGTIVVIVIYLAVNLAYFYTLTSSEVAGSRRVAATMMEQIAGPSGAKAVSVVVMISIFAALNGSILSGSRVPYALAHDGLFFRPFARVREGSRVPAFSILAMSLWSAVLVLSGRYEELFRLVIFPSWILYAMAAASVIVLRIKRPDLERPYRTPGYPVVPVAFVLVAVALLYSTLMEAPREPVMGLAIMGAGVPFYLAWRRRTGPGGA